MGVPLTQCPLSNSKPESDGEPGQPQWRNGCQLKGPSGEIVRTRRTCARPKISTQQVSLTMIAKKISRKKNPTSFFLRIYL